VGSYSSVPSARVRWHTWPPVRVASSVHSNVAELLMSTDSWIRSPTAARLGDGRVLGSVLALVDNLPDGVDHAVESEGDGIAAERLR